MCEARRVFFFSVQAPGALSIWFRHVQDTETHDSFRPQGCDITIDSPAVTAWGGSQMGALCEELNKINMKIVGGLSGSVGAGGYITGGGHSVFAPRYGLAAEQVSAMGDILIANECQNEDLFWAMRGGGGSTFCVMTSATLATHPTPKLVAASIAIILLGLDTPFTWDMAGSLLSHFPYLDSKSVSGYSMVNNNVTVPGSNGSTPTLAGIRGWFIMLDTEDPNDMLAAWAPIVGHINARLGRRHCAYVL